jgi:glycosyltransferase involved in cell wall biosynthesis
MKICFIDNVVEPEMPGRSGMSDTIWGMTRVLTNQQHSVDIISTYDKGPLSSPLITVHRCRTSSLSYRNIIGQMLFLLEVRQIVKKLSPDIIHLRDYFASAMLLSQWVSRPIVLTTPGNIFSRIREGHNYDWTVIKALRWGAKVSAKHCDAVIATSKGMREAWLNTGVPPNKLVTVPLGIDIDRFFYVPNARVQLGIPEHIPFLLYVGRYSPEKGLQELLDAIDLLTDLLREKRAKLC